MTILKRIQENPFQVYRDLIHTRELYDVYSAFEKSVPLPSVPTSIDRKAQTQEVLQRMLHLGHFDSLKKSYCHSCPDDYCSYPNSICPLLSQ